MSRKCLLFVSMIFIQILITQAASTVKPPTKSGDTPPTTPTTIPTTPTTTPTTPGSATTTPAAATTTPATSTVVTTMTTASSTTGVPTTLAPVPLKLGDNCTFLEDCKSTISGGVLCDDTCKCDVVNKYFAYNQTTCLNGTDLVPTVSVDPSTTYINVSWTHGIDTGNINNLTYNVTARSTAITKICTLGVPTLAHCSGLVQGTMYTIHVEVNVAGTEVAFDEKNQTTVPAIPGEINKLQSNLTGPNITLVWGKSAGTLDTYNITLLRPAPESLSVNQTDNRAQFYNLSDGKKYNVTITAVSNGVVSETRDDSFKTTVKVPDPPSSPQISLVTNNSAKLTWQAPADARGDLIGYQICRRSKVYADLDYGKIGCINTTDVTREYAPTGLSAGTHYRFEIFTINEEFISVGNVSIDQRTNEMLPGIVSNLTVTSYNDTLNVTWRRPAEPNGDITSYALRWIETASQSGNQCTVFFWTQSSHFTHMTPTNNIWCPNGTVNITVNKKELEYEILDLKAFTFYKISVTAYTAIGEGTDTTISKQTSLLKPDMVTDVFVDDINATAVNISWTISAKNPGLVNYTIVTWDVILNRSSDAIPCFKTDYNSTVCIQHGLQPFWKYSFQVRASNDAGHSLSDKSDVITTMESNPGAAVNITAYLYKEMDCDATKVRLEWKGPKLMDRRANITRYLITDQAGMIVKTYNVRPPIRPWDEDQSSELEIIEEKVTAETTFSWQIKAISSTNLNGTASTFSFTTDSCEPPAWGGRVNIESPTPPTTNSLTVKVDLTFFNDESQGEIVERGFVVNKKYEAVSNIQQIGDWRNSTQLYRIILDELKTASRALQDITIGSDHCAAPERFCNVFLPQDTNIYLIGYVCTKADRCRFTPTFGPFRTAKEKEPGGTSAGIVVSVTILVILVLGVAVFVALWYRGIIDPPGWFVKETEEDQQPISTLFPPTSKNRPIPINRFSETLEELHRDTNLRLSDQYEDIGKLGKEITETSTFYAANLEANKPKNRWVNILPYDHSRVKLQQLDDDDPTSDYINANYMPGFHNQREYIASQGPLPGTIDDFWRMVWEQNVKVIVMLTQCKEGNRVKCEMYWPDQLREAKQYGDIVVNPISISALDKYNISIFTVSMHGQERRVTHLHYLDFPDFSANVEYDHFLDFVTTARSLVPHDNDGPIIVHCSAGVGRTGTFIAMDRLQMSLRSPNFSYDDTVDIFNIVISLRENRVFMVQTESQYVLVHDCYLKMLEAKRIREMKTDSEDNLYSNDGFDPYPEVLYENLNPDDLKMKTEL